MQEAPMESEKARKDVLSKELNTFQRERAALIADPANLDQFALIHGDLILGLYSSFDAALAAGYDKVGLEPFLVKKITEFDEAPKYFSRNLR
jgi:hypothetical protein